MPVCSDLTEREGRGYALTAITVETLEVNLWCCSAPVQQWQDVAAEFPPDIAATLLPPEPKQKERGVTGARLTPDLSEAGRAVIGLLSTDEPVYIDTLAESLHIPVWQVAGALLELEMRELVRQLPGKCFVRKL